MAESNRQDEQAILCNTDDTLHHARPRSGGPLRVGVVGRATEEPTWVKIGDTMYGARADERGPIGGGPGYTGVVTQGDFVVKDLDGLLDALAQARAGQTVFIPGETEIDLTARIYIEQLVLDVPPSKSTTTHFARHSRPW